MREKVRLGISKCLLGEPVRYDGQHKLDRFLTETLGQYVDYVSVCPEVECGLPVPREAMRLVGDPQLPRLVTIRTKRDLTDQMTTWAAQRVSELAKEDLCGFIFKSRSPSSGMTRVKVYNGRGGMAGRGSGLFAAAFMAHFPLLPVEDEGRLNDPDIRENFIERVFAMDRYRRTAGAGRAVRALMDFHRLHKLLIMSHSPKHVKAMGALLAGGRPAEGDTALRRRYEALLLEALALRATPAKHANVLHHMLGYFKKQLSAAEKADVLELIEQMRAGMIPLIVPVTMFRHFTRRYGVAYLADQLYLNPHPLELKLRNHA